MMKKAPKAAPREPNAIRPELESLGRRLREARLAADLTQDQIAAQLGLSKQQISHWEVGRTEITTLGVIKFCSVTKSDLLWVLTGQRALNVPEKEHKIQVLDDAMAPALQTGDVALIDERRPPEPGDIICISIGKQTTFRRYLPAGGNGVFSGLAPATLVADNRAVPIINVDKNDEIAFLGTLVERRRRASR